MFLLYEVRVSRLATASCLTGLFTPGGSSPLAPVDAVELLRHATRMPSGEELALSYAAAWNVRDERERLELLRACCEDDVRFVQDGLNELVGVQALSDLIAQFWSDKEEGSGVRVEITSAVQEHHGFGRGSFVWIHPDVGEFTGTDFVERGPNGKMKTIVVFMDEPSDN